MEFTHTSTGNHSNHEVSYQSPNGYQSYSALKEERLPFTVKVAQSGDDLEKAVQIRHAAYARHVPEIAELLKEPEAFDFDDGSVVLLAESKLDGSALGSMRIQTNRFQALKLEASVTLPHWLQNQTLSEAARLGVIGNRVGKIVKILLFKAYYLYCIQEEIDWMVITARSPVDKDYEMLMFEDVFPDQGYIPMKHDANIEHRVMAFHVPSAERLWRTHGHPLYDLVFRTDHPDVDLRHRAISLKAKIDAMYPSHDYKVML